MADPDFEWGWEWPNLLNIQIKLFLTVWNLEQEVWTVCSPKSLSSSPTLWVWKGFLNCLQRWKIIRVEMQNRILLNVAGFALILPYCRKFAVSPDTGVAGCTCFGCHIKWSGLKCKATRRGFWAAYKSTNVNCPSCSRSYRTFAHFSQWNGENGR